MIAKIQARVFVEFIFGSPVVVTLREGDGTEGDVLALELIRNRVDTVEKAISLLMAQAKRRGIEVL